MVGLCVPLSTLRPCPCGQRRMTRGHRGSLLLSMLDSFIPLSMPVYPGALGSSFSDREPRAPYEAARRGFGGPREPFTHRSPRRVVPPTAPEEQTEPRSGANPPHPNTAPPGTKPTRLHLNRPPPRTPAPSPPEAPATTARPPEVPAPQTPATAVATTPPPRRPRASRIDRADQAVTRSGGRPRVAGV